MYTIILLKYVYTKELFMHIDYFDPSTTLFATLLHNILYAKSYKNMLSRIVVYKMKLETDKLYDHEPFIVQGTVE